jgi:hypothetical protein
MLADWIYNGSPWLSSGVFILAGIAIAGAVLVVVTGLISLETRHAHNEFSSLTVANIAVLYTVLLAFIAAAAWEDLAKASDVAGTEAALVQDLYIDARGLSDKRVGKELQHTLRRYTNGVVNGEWPAQQAGGISREAALALRDFRGTVASFEPKTQGDAIVMEEMLRSLNEPYNAR